MEFWNMTASDELAVALQTMIFYTILIPLTQISDRNPIQSSVYTKNHTADLTDHSPIVKL